MSLSGSIDGKMSILGFTNVIFLCAVRNSSDVLPNWFRSIRKLFPAPTQIIFCENDSTDNTVKLVKNCKIHHQLIQFKPKKIEGDTYAVIAQVRQILLDKAREIDPDYAIYLDDDVFPRQRNFISLMIKPQVDIIGGPYLRFFPEGLFIATKWIHPNYPNPKYLLRRPVPKKLIDEVEMTSGGCLCLSRSAIQDKRLRFYPMDEIRKDYEGCAEDFGFCLLAKKYGYRIWLNCKVAVAHYWRKRSRPWVLKGKKATIKYTSNKDFPEVMTGKIL